MTEEREATTHDEGIPAVDPGGAAPPDDRNEEIPGSPAPDPTAEDGGADDMPGAD